LLAAKAGLQSATVTVPAAIVAPSNAELLFTLHARGFQVYICRPEGWVLKAPEALLYDQQGKGIGTHFGGPTWQHCDGSEIVGKMSAKVDAPDAAAIPWLLLNVTSHSGEGIFSRVTFIQRIHTIGGLPLASFCSDSNHQAEFKSPYSADYYFYASR
jgi:hypothetical protein